MFRMLLQQHFKSLQPMHQPFGVIKSVDSQNDLLVRQHNLGRCFCQRDESVEGDSNGEWSDAHSPAAMLHQQVFPVHSTTQTSLAAVDKVQTVVLDVEPHHVATQHSLQNLVCPWEKSEDVPRREWDMEEEAQLQFQVSLIGRLSYPIGRQHQMIVVDPDQRCSILFLFLLLVKLGQGSDLN